MYSSSYIEINESALKKNIRFLKNEMGSATLISSVIKGNAYGHGIETFVPLAEKCGITHFSVFDANEAYRAFNSIQKNSEVMVMGYIDKQALYWAVGNGISFYVFEMQRLVDALKAANKIGNPAKIHLELETGLNRTGFNEADLKIAVDLIVKNFDKFKIMGICTHYAGAESIANYKRIQDQIELFKKTISKLKKMGINNTFCHTAASAAALSYPETRMDMVRVGIAQYGMWPSKETEMQYIMRSVSLNNKRYNDHLKQVLHWKSRVMSIKNVKRGEYVSYGNSYLTTRDLKIATVPIGYFHGFRRSLSNLGRVLIGGRRVGIVGTVNMNLILVNVTEIKNVKINDEVVIIGKQNRSKITVSSFSDMSNLLTYEALVRLSASIPRVVVK